MDAEDFLASKPVGWATTSGYETLTRLADLDGQPNWCMSRPPEDGGDWCGGLAEAADFLVNALGWTPEN